MQDIFKDKDEEKKDSVMDKLIMEVSQLLELVNIITARAAEM